MMSERRKKKSGICVADSVRLELVPKIGFVDWTMCVHLCVATEHICPM